MVMLLAYVCAQRSAIEWGDLIKAAFDIFLPDLQTKLQFRETASKEDERTLWTNFSRAVIYAVPEDMPERVLFEEGDDRETKS